MNGNFKPSELGKCDLQYMVTHKSANDFKKDDEVFIKSNPEWHLRVFGISEMFNKVLVLTPENMIESFVPEILLKYSEASLMWWRYKFIICLN